MAAGTEVATCNEAGIWIQTGVVLDVSVREVRRLKVTGLQALLLAAALEGPIDPSVYEVAEARGLVKSTTLLRS